MRARLKYIFSIEKKGKKRKDFKGELFTIQWNICIFIKYLEKKPLNKVNSKNNN